MEVFFLIFVSSWKWGIAMKGYDNGVGTQTLILAVCKELFYKKGGNESCYQDICQNFPCMKLTRVVIDYSQKA